MQDAAPPPNPIASERAPDAPCQPAARRITPAVVSVTSERLFAGAAEVQIDHRGVVYRLKQTSLGKLILTK
jgi:hemin uptake protein HemP